MSGGRNERQLTTAVRANSLDVRSGCQMAVVACMYSLH